MKADITIIGAGIVGLATAYKIQERNPGLKMRVLEKENKVSAHQTGNNSGVIHSGIYYKPGSLKARNCIYGYKLLLDFCDKVIIASGKQELPGMEFLYKRGIENGLEGLKLLKKEELNDYEPYVAGLGGILVPQTGIIDFKEVSKKLEENIRANGAEFHFGQKVRGIKIKYGEAFISTKTESFNSKLVINCTGLYSDKVARFTHQHVNVKVIPFRGEYYKIRPEKIHLVKNLIYPVPDPSFPFLGVHYTRMIDGGVEAGPNAVLAFAREGYRKSQINLPELAETLTWPGFIKVASKYWKTGIGEMYRSFSKKAFTRALQKLIPEIEEKDLDMGGAGVRAQACDRSGGLLDDFLIYENESAINVCNAPSPAATSALAIGEKIAEIAGKRILD